MYSVSRARGNVLWQLLDTRPETENFAMEWNDDLLHYYTAFQPYDLSSPCLCGW